jgi:hypothetical protein
MKSDVQLKPISAISRIVCLIAQITLSMNNLKLFGGSVNKAIEILSKHVNYCERLDITWETVLVDRAKQLEES